MAGVDPGGRISAAPHRATPPIGEQALVSLMAAPWAPGAGRSKRALLAWEDQLKVPREGRLIHLATVGPDAALGKERATLTFSASGPPDLVADGDGFAAMTLAPVPGLGGDDEAPQPGKRKPPPPVLPDVSSTEVRTWLARRGYERGELARARSAPAGFGPGEVSVDLEARRRLAEVVPRQVLDYIDEHDLYR